MLTQLTAQFQGAYPNIQLILYIKDFGALLAALGTHDQALGQVWFAPSNPPLTQAEFVKLMEAKLGRPVKSQVGCPLLMRFLGLFNKGIAETVEMMYEWINPYVVDTSKAEQTFGMKPAPLPQAIKETLDWWKTQPAA